MLELRSVALRWLVGGMVVTWSVQAEPVEVTVHDHGMTSSVAGAGAPAHVIGLTRVRHDITVNTGAAAYALRYAVAKDPNDPTVAIPGEGYIGMPGPVDGNWYGGGFFDLKLNEQSVGNRWVTAFIGQAQGDRGYVDFVFDTPQAMVRVRFVGLAGDDALYTQVLLEPREEIHAVSLSLRCYPSGFINGVSRRVLTAARELAVGQQEPLALGQEWWLNFFDTTRGLGARGEGGCSVIWLPEQADRAVVNVGRYSVDTNLQLKPALCDFRFVFFDHTGQANAAAQERLAARAAELRQTLVEFGFTDPTVAGWPVAERLAQARQLAAEVADEPALAAGYEAWAQALSEHLASLHAAGPDSAILAEANALKTIVEWERSLPALRLRALLQTF